MTQSKRLLELEERINKLEEIISYNQKDLELLCNTLISAQEHLAKIYLYLDDLELQEIHYHYYKITHNYPPETCED